MNRPATGDATYAIPANGTRTRIAASVAAAIVALLLTAGSATAAPQLQFSLKTMTSEAQQVLQRGNSGEFRLRFGQGGPGVAETGDLPYDATAAQVEDALNALSNVSAGGGSVTVDWLDVFEERVYRIDFDGGPLAGTDVPQLVGVNGTTPLTGVYPGELLAVETVEPAGVRRGDKRLDYVVQMRNDAPAGSVPSVGDSLTCGDREPSWAPNVASGLHPTVTVEWWRNGEPIPGATSNFYTATAADAGAAIQCVVRASNAAGTTVLPTLPGVVVNPQPATAPPAPSDPTASASSPDLLGVRMEERTCSTASMNWTPGTSYTMQWLRNGAEIPGETGSTYTPQFTATGTGTATSGSNQITGVTTSTGAFAVGQRLGSSSSSFVPFTAGATITSIDGNTITVSANATTTTSVSLFAGGDAATVLQCRVLGTNAGGALVGMSRPSAVGVSSEPTLDTTFSPLLLDSGLTSGLVSLVVELPVGANGPATKFTAFPDVNTDGPPAGWSCMGIAASGSDPAKAVCTRSDSLGPQEAYPGIRIGVNIDADATDTFAARASVTGGGSPPVPPATDSFDIMAGSALPFGFMAESMDTYLVDDPAGDDSTQAGGHAWAAGARVGLNLKRQFGRQFVYSRTGSAGGLAKRIRTDAPPGLVGNATAPVLCESARSLANPPVTCPPESFVGVGRFKTAGTGYTNIGPYWSRYPMVAVEPERGVAAQFAFADPFTRGVYVLSARLRPEDGYAITIDTAPIPSQLRLLAAGATICSYGANVNLSSTPRFDGCKQPGDPGAFEKPILTNPTSCTVEPPVTTMLADSWENPGVFASSSVEEPLMEGCHQVPFTPSVSMSPTSDTADGASGFDASIDVPVDGFEDPDGVSQSHLKKTVVKLPEGVSVNPSAATGLEGCSDEQLGLKTDSEPLCPDGSKLGTVTATTPALEETLSGVMVLRTPKSTDPTSGEMLRVALIVRNDERGILVKLPGSATADPETGRLVATFDDNPQLPIGHVEVKLRGGDKGVLAMPRDCGELSTEAALSPWSRPTSRDVTDTASTVDQRCGDGFSPKLSAGSSDNRARGQGGTYSFRFSREDGEQWLRGLTAKLPKGLLASVKDVPLCSNGLADAGNCPAGSKIGVVDAKAGSGDPFVLEEKGEVFLTEGYKGGEYGLVVKVRPVAGPFRGEHELSPIVVRQAIHVDRTTAEVTAVSDPFPLIHHGIPLRAREVNVLVNRGGFMVNPSDCDQKQSSATLLSDEGTTAGFSDPFQVSNCGALAFKPKLTLALTGKRQVTTGKHPGIRAQVTQQGTSEAGIEQAVVRLPKSLALDVNNAQALCEFVDGTKPDLENHCPAGSIVGRARAKTPLLKDDLVGNVYFVKNVRKDPTTGNEIRTLPMIIVALRGEISINLKGESDTTKAGKLVSTFASVPDAPITQFNLNIAGGSNGIIAVTRTRRAKINLCAGRHTAESDIDGHNGRRHDTDIRMKTPCTKKQVKKAKRAARAQR